jgi:hypothetical protein
VLLRKDKGGSTVEGITWKHDGDVEEVPGDLARSLLGIRGGGYSVATEDEAKAAAPAPKQAPAAPAVKAEPAPAKPAAKP